MPGGEAALAFGGAAAPRRRRSLHRGERSAQNSLSHGSGTEDTDKDKDKDKDSTNGTTDDDSNIAAKSSAEPKLVDLRPFFVKEVITNSAARLNR